MVPSVLARVLAIIAPIAQRIEQQSSKLWVEGSSPSWGTSVCFIPRGIIRTLLTIILLLLLVKVVIVFMAVSSKWLGRHSFKVEIRVQFPILLLEIINILLNYNF